jgi:hypothetical protein
MIIRGAWARRLVYTGYLSCVNMTSNEGSEGKIKYLKKGVPAYLCTGQDATCVTK